MKKRATRRPEAISSTAVAKPPRGRLELRTYDPVSGVVLKYRTSKGAEVTHLVQMLGTLGRRMAGLPPRTAEDVPMADVAAEPVTGSGTQTPVPAASGGSTQQQQTGAGKGKKKKGKK
jgi:hypothetical protein